MQINIFLSWYRMKVLIHDNWGEIGLPRRARICWWVKGIITRGTPSFWYIRSTENLEVNSGNKQGARCSKSLCAVQAEQGAAAQAVDAFQVEGGSSFYKMLSMEWVIQRTGPTERLGCFVPKRTVVINCPIPVDPSCMWKTKLGRLRSLHSVLTLVSMRCGRS